MRSGPVIEMYLMGRGIPQGYNVTLRAKGITYPVEGQAGCLWHSYRQSRYPLGLPSAF